MTIELILLAAAALLLLSVIASGVWSRLGIPSLLLFLALGMLAGSDGPGQIRFDDAQVAQSLGVVALIFILFSGGLDTEWKHVRPVLKEGLALSTVGVLLTAVLVGVFAHQVLGLSPVEGILLGAIVSSTDAAAVFSIFRSAGTKLKKNLTNLLEFESGSNDPMAVFLTLAAIQLLTAEVSSPWQLGIFFLQQMVVGGALGFLFGRLTALLLNRIRLEHEGLYPVMTLGMVLLTYGAISAVGGNGFLAVYVAGIVVGNTRTVRHDGVLRFHDGIAWLMQIAMFLTLGLLVFPSRIGSILVEGLLVSAFLILIARPVGVFLTLLPLRVRPRECLLISWVGLRGAVPIILATFPLLAGLEGAEYIFDLVFFIVLTSAVVQGTTLARMARWLGLEEEPPQPVDGEADSHDAQEVLELVLDSSAGAIGMRVVDLDRPAGLLLALVRRGEQAMIPSGSTILQEGDRLMLVGTKQTIEDARWLFGDSAEPPEPGEPPEPAGSETPEPPEAAP